jgi:hypothetical protein
VVRRSEAPRIAALWLVATIAHLPLLRAGFVNWDDDRFIVQNPVFHGPTSTYVWRALTEVQFEAYQPLHLLSYLPDRLLWPDAALGFHLLNLVLFCAALTALYALARRYTTPRAAVLATLVLALHPLAVEPVAWITGRKDVLSLLLFVSVLLVEDRRTSSRPSPVGLALASAALLTKTATMCLPLVLVCWSRFFVGLPLSVALKRSVPYALLAGAAALGTLVLWRHHLLIPERPLPAPVDVLSTLSWYALKVVVPVGLSPIYPPVASGAMTLAAVFSALAVAMGVGHRRLSAPGRFAALAFLAALAPVSNIVPLYFRYADRYALFALAVLVVPLACGIQALERRSIPVRRCALGLLALLGSSTFVQTSYWRDSDTLWQRATKAQPSAYFAWLKRGETARKRGQTEDAVAAYQAAIRVDPHRSLGYTGLFYTYTLEAEDRGDLASGTATAWLGELELALADRVRFERLLGVVARRRCYRCLLALTLEGVRLFDAPDPTRLRQAEVALATHSPEVALIYLDAVRDRTSPRYQTLAAQAREALPPPRSP